MRRKASPAQPIMRNDFTEFVETRSASRMAPDIPKVLDAEGDVVNELNARLQAWNEQQIGPRHTRRITLVIRDGEGRLVGGLEGELHWNTFYLGTPLRSNCRN